MKKVIIFGTNDTAELAHFYLNYDSNHEVAGFTLTEEFLSQEEFRGLPVIGFENIEKLYPPESFDLFVPMTARNMNKDRERIYLEAQKKGYGFISYVSSKATTFPEIVIGDNCFILENNTIQPFSKIGNNVVLWSGNHIGHHSEIRDHTFITSHVVVSGNCVVDRYCFLGVNSTIRDYINLAEGTFIVMGANITKNSEPYSVYFGNPARKGPKRSTQMSI